MRCITGTGSTHVTNVCKPGMAQIWQQLMERETEREKEKVSLLFLGAWEKLSATLSFQEYQLGPEGGLKWADDNFTEDSHGAPAGRGTGGIHHDPVAQVWLQLLNKITSAGMSCPTMFCGINGELHHLKRQARAGRMWHSWGSVRETLSFQLFSPKRTGIRRYTTNWE